MLLHKNNLILECLFAKCQEFLVKKPCFSCITIAIILTCGSSYSCICCRTPTNYYCGTKCVVVKGLLCDVIICYGLVVHCIHVHVCVVYNDCRYHKCLHH